MRNAVQANRSPQARRTRLEPLEARVMLSTVNWQIDAAQSSTTVAFPDQTIPIAVGGGTVNATIHFGNQSQTNDGTHAWTVGNTSAIDGLLTTDYVDGASIRLLDGMSSMVGLPSGSYIPNPAVWNPVTHTYADQSTSPAEFGVRVHATALGGFVNADASYVALSNVAYNAASVVLPIDGSGQFVANTLSMGASSATFASLGLPVPVVGQLSSSLDPLAAGSLFGVNTTSSGTISTPDPAGHPLARHLSLPFNIPTQISFILSGQTVTLTATITGKIEADATLPPSSIVGRQLFYENSTRYDTTGNPQTPLPFSDDNAIASDKVAYLPNGSIAGGTTAPATFANISSYDRGINGVMIDMAGGHGALTAADFTFRVGNNNTSSAWTTPLAVAAATVSVRRAAGVAGSDRIELVWPDNTIRKQWLQVIVHGNDLTGSNNLNSGLATSDIFFFGNAVADSVADMANARVDINDELASRNNAKLLGQNIPITNAFDYNRDGAVNIIDQLLARNNQTLGPSITQFILIGVPPAAPEIEHSHGAATFVDPVFFIASVSAVAGGVGIAGPTANLESSTSYPHRQDLVLSPLALGHLYEHPTHSDMSLGPHPLSDVAGAMDRFGLDDEALAHLLARRR